MTSHRYLSGDKGLNSFTLVETIVTIAVIVIIVAIGLPAFSSAISRSRQIKSINNLRTIGQAIHLYAADNQGVLPLMCGTSGGGFSNPIWSTDILGIYVGSNNTTNGVVKDPELLKNHGGLGDYAANSDVLHCAVSGYSSSPSPLPVAALGARSSKVIMVVAAEDGSRALPNGAWYVSAFGVAFNPQGPYSRPSDRGTGRVLAVFADGHTEAILKTNLISDIRNYFLVNP